MEVEEAWSVGTPSIDTLSWNHFSNDSSEKRIILINLRKTTNILEVHYS